MPVEQNRAAAAAKVGPMRRIRRFLPLAIVVILAAAVLMSDLRGILSLEMLVRHRAAIDAFIDTNEAAAIASYIGLYLVAVALSLPGAALLTVAGGFLFGVVPGALAAIVGSTAGAMVLFLVARSAFGDNLLRRVGPRAARLAEGFKRDAFNYLLFLRLVPAFPFWLVNLAAALFAVRLPTFVVATAIGVIPGAFAFAFGGAGLGSVIDAQTTGFQECLASADAQDCRIDFNPRQILTPELLGALVALGALALVPVVVKRWRSVRGKALPPS